MVNGNMNDDDDEVVVTVDDEAVKTDELIIERAKFEDLIKLKKPKYRSTPRKKIFMIDKPKDKNSQPVFIPKQDEEYSSVIQPTELGESLRELNLDSRDNPEHMMSSIDLRANLDTIEMPYVLALDALIHLRVITPRCLGFSRQKKRLSCSQGGFRSKQMVDIVVGKREHDSNSGFFKRIGEGFGHITGGGKQNG